MNAVRYFFLGMLGMLWVSPLSASPFVKGKKAPILLKADQMRHEEGLDHVIAEGHVIASDGNQVVEADRLVYNKRLNTITATGNITLYGEDGSVVNAQYVELSSDFKKAFLEKGHLLTPDEERIAATSVKKDSEKTVYQNMVYSPCRVCETKDPLWQMKAKKVIYDEQDENFYYYDALMEFKGIPVFYTPYFSHAGPNAKRRSGFLGPFFSSQRSLGGVIGTPYYVNIAPNRDMTLTPIFTTKASHMMMGEYRHRMENASLFLTGSITKTDALGKFSSGEKRGHKRMQGHFLAEAQVDLNDHWRFHGKGLTASDPAYLKRYHFLEGQKYWRQNYLESNTHFEGFYGRNYLGLHSYYFQNIREDVDSKRVPTILPATNFSYFSPVMAYDSYIRVTGNTLSLRRQRGNRMNRISTTTAWMLPYTAAHGSVYELEAFVRGDYYDIRKYDATGPFGQVNGGIGRIIPGASLSWRFPFVTYLNSSKLVIEPVIKLVAKPNSLNNPKIPNEDSQDFEFDARNLFARNRFIGYDLIDEGQHASYGFNINAYRIYGVNVRAFLGQSYDFSKARGFLKESGVRQGASDYLGRLKVIPSEWGHIDWRFRLCNKTGRLKRNLLSFVVGPQSFRMHVDYLYHDNVYFDENFGRREQVSLRVSSKLTSDWSAFVGARREFKKNPGPLEESVGAVYEDECFKVIVEGLRTHYRDRDMAPATVVMFTLGFKNLGNISTGRIAANQLTA